MPALIDDPRPIKPRRCQRTLAFLANITSVYPLLFVGLVYVEWLLSWWLLGHRPEWSTDDPAQISGSNWIYPIAMLMLMGIAPTAIAMLVFNVAHVYVAKPSAARIAIRMLTIFVVWIGVYIWLQYDPGQIMQWWID